MRVNKMGKVDHQGVRTQTNLALEKDPKESNRDINPDGNSNPDERRINNLDS